MTQLTDKHWAVEVPDDACKFSYYPKSNVLVYFLGEHPIYEEVPMPPGIWQYLFTTKRCSEEDARKVVRELPVGQRFENYNGDYPVWYHTERESFQSLLRSKGCDENKNWAIIQKQTKDATTDK